MAAGEIAKRPTHFTGRRNRQTAVQTRPPFLLSRWQSGESFPYRVLWFRLCTIHLAYYEVGLGCFLVVGSFAACLLRLCEGEGREGKGGLN